MASLLGHERRQLHLYLSVASQAKELRVDALRLDVLQQPLDSGALPAARKDAGEEGSEVAPGGRLAAAKASLDALLSIANGADAAQRRLSKELGLDTAEVRARASGTKDPPPCRHSFPLHRLTLL